MKRPPDLITTADARCLLDVSGKKMAQLIKDGTIKTYPDPLDRRVKLVSRAYVMSLRIRSEVAV